MAVKHTKEISSQPVNGATLTTIQILLEGPNYIMRRFVMKPGGGMPNHTNLVEHEQYVVEGNALIGVGNERYQVKTGDVVFIPGEVPHWYQNNGNTDFVFLCIIPNKKDQITMVDAESC